MGYDLLLDQVDRVLLSQDANDYDEIVANTFDGKRNRPKPVFVAFRLVEQQLRLAISGLRVGCAVMNLATGVVEECNGQDAT